MPLYRLGVTESGEGEEEVKSVFLFTERGVYKPGDVVHLKGFARNLEGGQSSLPAGETVKVTVTDAKDREIFNKQVTLSDFGSFAEEITVSVIAATVVIVTSVAFVVWREGRTSAH